MPLYDFECPECKKVEEHLIMDGNTDLVCSDCFCYMKKLITGSYMINMPTGNSVGKENYS